MHPGRTTNACGGCTGVLLVALCLAGCGGGGTGSSRGLDVIFTPSHDVVDGVDPAKDLPLADAPRDGLNDAVKDAPGDAAPDPARDAPPEDGGGEDPGTDPGVPSDEGPIDPGAIDPGPGDPGTVDPGATDAGFDVAVGACAPDDAQCWCTNDSHCNPSYHRTCQRNQCNPTTHHCHVNLLSGTTCDDGDACTTGDACQQGACQPGTFTCECRVDGDCDDSNPCTTDSCGAGTCLHGANTAACDDGNPCTDGDHCSAKTCVPGTRTCECMTAAECDDGNDCTTDTCRPDRTCLHQPFAGPCDDGNPCTSGDACQAGECVSGAVVCECQTAAQCDDGNPCTDDRCTAQFACAHTNNAAACDDGDSCTTNDVCSGGTCRAGTVACARCNDGVCFKPAETCSSCPADCGACPASESDCANGYDDDGDGATDCADTDCSSLPDCRPQTCFSFSTGSCGLTHSAYASGASISGTFGASCGNVPFKPGYRARIFEFQRPTSGQVKVRCDLPGQDQLYDIYVLESVCNPMNCMTYDRATINDSYTQVTFTAQAGRTYYIVVVDTTNNINYYDLAITCP